MELQVIDVDQITRKVFFTVKPKQVTGISRLIQIIVLSLLNISDKDVLDPVWGAGMPSLIGSNITPSDSTEVYGEIVRRVKKSETEIINNQIGLDLPPTERLVQLQIVDMKMPEIDEIAVRIRVINESGQATDIVV